MTGPAIRSLAAFIVAAIVFGFLLRLAFPEIPTWALVLAACWGGTMFDFAVRLRTFLRKRRDFIEGKRK